MAVLRAEGEGQSEPAWVTVQYSTEKQSSCCRGSMAGQEGMEDQVETEGNRNRAADC